jgi:hypothetical protein
MADLFNQQISATYSGLLKTSSSGVLSASLSQISDGRGNTSPLYLSTGSIQFYGAYSFPNADGLDGQVLKTDGAGVLTWENDANSGTVTSVALSVPTGLTVTNSPITTSGTIAITNASGYSIPTDAKQTQWDTAYTNRITTATSPLSITTNTISLNTVPVSNGGTGATTLTGILLGNGTSAISSVTDGTTSGQVLSTNANGTYSFIDAAGGDVNISGTPVANQIAIWTDASTIKGDATLSIDNNHEITLYQPRATTPPTDSVSYNIGGGNTSVHTGLMNTGFGWHNLNLLTTANYNSAFGSNCLLSVTSGGFNTAVGSGSGQNIITSSESTSIGYEAMKGTTIATMPNGVGGANTAIGYRSLKIIEGAANTAIGYQSGSAITTGSNNVIIGSNTGNTIATSSNNIIISDGSGNIRQSFDINGAATFSSSVTSGGLVTINKINEGLVLTAGANTDASYMSTRANNGTGWMVMGSQGTTSGYIQSGTGANESAITTIGAYALSLGTNQVERLRISSGGDVTITTTTNEGGLTITSATDNTTLRLSNQQTGGKEWRLYSTGGTSGYGQGNFIIRNHNNSINALTISSTGTATFSGSVSKASGSFKIDHPLESKKDTHHLVHSFVESPQANNIYRGKVDLVNGTAQVNLDDVSTMTEGTFILLNTDIHCYTSNETNWDAVKGNVEGNILTIECQNNESNASVNWLVIGERHDPHMLETEWTDDEGKVIVEPLKPIIESKEEEEVTEEG